MQNDKKYLVEILDRNSSALYENALNSSRFGFIQQSILWSDVICASATDKPFFLTVKRNDSKDIIAGLPLYLFETELGSIITSVPHAGALGGVFLNKDLNDSEHEEIYTLLTYTAIEFAKKQKCIALSIITNPLHDDSSFYISEKKPNYTFTNFSQISDLETLLDEHGQYCTGKSRYNSHIRRNIANVKNSGAEIRWATDEEYLEWYEIHFQRHSDIGLTPLPKDILLGIKKTLQPINRGGLIIANQDSEIMGGILFIWNKNVADFFMPAVKTEKMNLGYNYGCLDLAIRYFRNEGIRYLNWQSSSRNSGVFDFKKRWGAKEVNYQFHTWTFEGFENIFDKSIEEIENIFQWHYLAPFQAIIQKKSNGLYSK